AVNSQFDQSQLSCGLFSQNGTIVRLTNDTANQNGTGTANPGLNAQYGRGFVFTNDTTATLLNDTADYNADHGLIAQGNTAFANVLIIGSHFDFNANANGAIINALVNLKVIGSSFSENGGSKARGAFGFNGLELDTTGSTQIYNSIFQGNTAFGLFVGNG